MANLARRRLIGGVLAGVSGLALTGTTAFAAPHADTPSLFLPRPTGPHPVGAQTVYLKDTSRTDPWVPTQNFRELMVTLWYPTRDRHGQKLPYMSPLESRTWIEAKRMQDVLALEILSTVRTHAAAGAAAFRGGLPLIILSPGYTQPRPTLTALAEDLASHGYAVGAIDHTYETYAVTFPDGRIASCATCAVDEDPAFFGKLHRSRALDVSFVISSLLGRFGRLIDASRIGMSGHSAGGASAIGAMVADPRIAAGIDMDGQSSDLIPATGLGRPFMFFGSDGREPGGPAQSWDREWAYLTGWKRWFVVNGTAHASFTDLGLFAEQLDIDLGATVPGSRAMQITRAYNLAFFDKHLRRRAQPLLDRLSPHYPEVILPAR